MKFQITFIICTAFTTKLVFGEVWEFGENVPTSTLISHNQGDISLLDKSRSIHITEPECHEIDYVRVEVNNIVSNPAVYYNKITHVVTISYKPLQISMSTYDVIAKAKKKPACSVQSETLELVYG